MRSMALTLLIVLMALEGVSGKTQGSQLPVDLSEDEVQLILKERKLKSHVEAAFKVSDARLSSALKLARDSQYRESSQNLDLYVSLVSYADSYARRSTSQGTKERHSVLKVIEQKIFKQNLTLEAILHELPFEYQENSSKAVEAVKRIRIRALDEHLGGGAFLKSATNTPE
jgi:hypothetical protein